MSFDISSLSDNYPGGKSDSELVRLISEMQTELHAQQYQPNFLAQLMPLIQLGLFELGKRSNNRVTRISQTVGVVSVLVAGVALWISIASTSSNSNWEANQMHTLNQIQDKVSTLQKQDEAYILLKQISDLQSANQSTLTEINERLNRELCVRTLALGDPGKAKACE